MLAPVPRPRCKGPRARLDSGPGSGAARRARNVGLRGSETDALGLVSPPRRARRGGGVGVPAGAGTGAGPGLSLVVVHKAPSESAVVPTPGFVGPCRLSRPPREWVAAALLAPSTSEEDRGPAAVAARGP